MDVRQPAPTNVSAAHRALESLNKATHSSAAPARWNAALNDATHARANAAPDAGVNGASRSYAGFAARQGDLNNRLTAHARTQAAYERTQAREQALAHPTNPKDVELQKKAETLVNQFFMGTMLKQMRDSPFKSEMFGGGKGGDAFAGLFDQRIAEHSGNRVAQDLVKAMVKAYRKREAAIDPDNGSGLSVKHA